MCRKAPSILGHSTCVQASLKHIESDERRISVLTLCLGQLSSTQPCPDGVSTVLSHLVRAPCGQNCSSSSCSYEFQSVFFVIVGFALRSYGSRFSEFGLREKICEVLTGFWRSLKENCGVALRETLVCGVCWNIVVSVRGSRHMWRDRNSR
jgi:hypothetical protein